MTTREFFYWCDQQETWVRCAEEEYRAMHADKSFDRLLESRDNNSQVQG